jgi:uncharacterized membrane protein (UPF0182 family)
MPQPLFEPIARRRRTGRAVTIAVSLIALLIVLRSGATLAMEWGWWSEVGQLDTWLGLFTYAYAPVTVGTILAFAALWITSRRAFHFAGGTQERNRIFGVITVLILLFIAWFIAAATLEGWTVVRYFGSRGIAEPANAFRDPVFQEPLKFYLFDLPFYSILRSYLLTLFIACAFLFWIAARFRQLSYRFHELRGARELDLSILRLPGGLESQFLRAVIAVILLAFACRFFLGRYEMVWNDHGFMVGIDWLDDHVTLPLQWALIFAAVCAAIFAWLGRWRFVLAMIVVVPICWIIPRLVSALYVKPNEISLETPYINSHIHATRSAYGLENHVQAVDYKTGGPSAVQSLDVNANRNLLDNVRLWDWRAFHDTVTQSQALRPYYVFHDTDIDRYTIDGEYRQTLLAPRELDISQLPNSGWINPRFIYTHGYGLALAEVSHITPEGLPVFLVQNMPPEIRTPSLKISQPDLYYGEVTHEPVFVHTSQEEFDYPSGADNAKIRYSGRGGFPISALYMRLAAAIHFADPNIILTNYLTGDSRIMIHRRITDRVATMAPFLDWDYDPYLVITPDGRLVWMLDGYTVSDAHPYARPVDFGEGESINYIRNSVKATIDAYDGTVHLYVFDPADPLLQAYRNLFPRLFEPESAMPPALRAHARYPEALFRIQASVYRTYHMLNPQAFYNHEDIWELARFSSGQEAAPQPVNPTYVVATLPGEEKPEFMLMTSFTPTSKENLIGVMLARCDGAHLGEVVVLQLSKQELILGPMQISARINQDQTISKDLTLWNQQGSQVLRGQMLVLPVAHTFLYVSPIYIQATEARMPQLRKVVLAMGNRLIYTDTYEQALAMLNQPLANESAPASQPSGGTNEPQQTTSAPAVAGSPDAALAQIRAHFQRYRELTAQGKLSEAGHELDLISQQLR